METRNDDGGWLPYNQLTICPPDVEHRMRDMRSKSGFQNGKWHFWKKCKNCCILLETIIGEKILPNGDLIPEAKSFFIKPYGAVPAIEIGTDVWECNGQTFTIPAKESEK